MEEVDVKGVLKSSIFVVQKATAPKSGVEFCQGSIGAIRSSVAMPYEVWKRCAPSPEKWIRNEKKKKQAEAELGQAQHKLGFGYVELDGQV